MEVKIESVGELKLCMKLFLLDNLLISSIGKVKDCRLLPTPVAEYSLACGGTQALP